MHTDLPPLTWASAAESWRFEPSSALVIVALSVGFLWCARRARRRGERIESGRAWCFGIGIALFALATMSMVGVYAYALFWVRALQVLLLLLIVPFFLAAAKPLTLVRNALSETGRDAFDRRLATSIPRVLAHPLTTSVAMLATPWLLYLTPWYTASLTNGAIGALTGIILMIVGFLYFYARLQADPVPHKYSQLISLLISIAETIGDGVLGLVLWQGPLIATDYYSGLHRVWGPSQRLDQTIGAGVLWILGDVLGIPFVLLLIRALSADERTLARKIDAELDEAELKTAASDGSDQTDQPVQSTLWWENDPQLRERFRRR